MWHNYVCVGKVDVPVTPGNALDYLTMWGTPQMLMDASPMTSALPLKESISGCCHTGAQVLAQKLLRKTPELSPSHRRQPPALVLGCDRV